MSWLNQTWAPYSAKSGKVPKSGNDISYETTPDHFDVGPMTTLHSQSGDMHEYSGPSHLSKWGILWQLPEQHLNQPPLLHLALRENIYVDKIFSEA